MNTNHSLHRYTSIPILLDMLVNKKITLVDPAFWEDRNDAFYIGRYKEIKQYKTVLVLCFTTKPETFHHWKVFAGNSGGVCIRFNKDKLISCFGDILNIRKGLVKYRLIKHLQNKSPTKNQLPFLKRKQYEDEAEFRILYVNKKKEFKLRDFPLDIDSIERITLNPWIPSSVIKSVERVICDIPGCSSISTNRTGIIESSDWKDIATEIKIRHYGIS